MATGGTINLDGKSSLRRTCSLSIFLKDNDYSGITNVGNKFAINTKVYVEVGFTNNTDQYKKYPIIWYPQGLFIINSVSSSHSTNGTTLSFQFKDKMCLLNGMCGGTLPASTQFDQYETADENGNLVIEHPVISKIVREGVNHFGNEQLGKILISDLDDRVKTVMKWTGNTPLYLVSNNGNNRMTTTYEEIEDLETTEKKASGDSLSLQNTLNKKINPEDLTIDGRCEQKTTQGYNILDTSKEKWQQGYYNYSDNSGNYVTNNKFRVKQMRYKTKQQELKNYKYNKRILLFFFLVGAEHGEVEVRLTSGARRRRSGFPGPLGGNGGGGLRRPRSGSRRGVRSGRSRSGYFISAQFFQFRYFKLAFPNNINRPYCIDISASAHLARAVDEFFFANNKTDQLTLQGRFVKVPGVVFI